MSDVLIMAYPKVEYSTRKQSYKVATVFHGIPLICLMTVPQKYFEHTEFEIEEILEHETLHIILDKIAPSASWKFDKISPFTHSLVEVKNK